MPASSLPSGELAHFVISGADPGTVSESNDGNIDCSNGLNFLNLQGSGHTKQANSEIDLDVSSPKNGVLTDGSYTLPADGATVNIEVTPGFGDPVGGVWSGGQVANGGDDKGSGTITLTNSAHTVAVDVTLTPTSKGGATAPIKVTGTGSCP